MTCAGCNTETEDFRPGRKKCRGCERSYARERARANAEQHRENARRQYWADPEAARARTAAYFQTEKGKEARRRSYERHAEKRRAKSRNYYWANREERLARQAAYKAANREKVNNQIARTKRARKYGALGDYTDREFNRLRARYHGKCFYCQERKADQRDHVIPLSRGGSNYIGNIVPVCGFCNLSKNDRTVMEWRLARREQ